MQNSQSYQYLFGPVPSRRLGRSLGVDLVPFKYCTLDCVYCQLGATTEKTITRREFMPMEAVLAEIDRKLASETPPDYITMAGSGEPTLYSRLGELIAAIKQRTAVPVAVITNGTLLWDPAVRQELYQADLVVPSLDAADPDLFESVNRPHSELHLSHVIAGLEAFRKEFTHTLWLEVVILDTTTEDDVERLAEVAQRISPDKIQLNTAVRPPTESWAKPVTRDRMARYAALFGARTEVVAEFKEEAAAEISNATPEDVLGMIGRHPCSLADIVSGLRIRQKDADELLSALLKKNAIRAEDVDGVTYYVAIV